MSCDPGETELRDLISEEDDTTEDEQGGSIFADSEPVDPDHAHDLLRERDWFSS